MSMLPGNYGSVEGLKERRRKFGHPYFRWDFTINIPTLITLVTLAITFYTQIANMYKTTQTILRQHQVMWSVFAKEHKDLVERFSLEGEK